MLRTLIMHWNFLIILYTIPVTRCMLEMQKIPQQDFVDGDGRGSIAAFGDVNSDKQTDVFVLEDGGKLTIYNGSETKPFLRLSTVTQAVNEATSVVSADFNGDNTGDILVTKKSGKAHKIIIYNGRNMTSTYRYSETLSDEPLVLDANGDMVSDLFVVYANFTSGFLIGQKTEELNFTEFPFSKNESHSQTYYPHSHAFIDLTGEGSADLFLTGTESYEVWTGSENGLRKVEVIALPIPDPSMVVGPAAFADFTSNAQNDIVVATCRVDGKCIDNKIMIHTDDWHTLFELPENWSFPYTKSGGRSHINSTLHIGDVNLDSYPDIMTILKDDKGNQRAVIFYNIPCKSDYCSSFERQLGNLYEIPGSGDVLISAFYDFRMDGTLDVILSVNNKGNLSMIGYLNDIADDVTFLRVQVLTSSKDPTYGVNVPGPQITYYTTNTSGQSQHGRLAQMSQSAHNALQLPYVLFGLGRLANFVDKLTVSVPVSLIDFNNEDTVTQTRSIELSSDDFTPLNQTWPMLIPNSQLYVIPYPRNTPSSWTNKLLVRPGSNVIMTGVVLLCTCGVMAIATIILHWLEKREDRREKIQEAYRFHFDAM